MPNDIKLIESFLTNSFAQICCIKVINVVLNYVTLSEGLICHLRKEDPSKFMRLI